MHTAEKESPGQSRGQLDRVNIMDWRRVMRMFKVAALLLTLVGLGFSYLPTNVFSYLGQAKTNIAPRFGFSYQVLPNTVIRGAFGLFYNLIHEFADFFAAERHCSFIHDVRAFFEYWSVFSQPLG
jgi:integral membrane sensor domain MASE1